MYPPLTIGFLLSYLARIMAHSFGTTLLAAARYLAPGVCAFVLACIACAGLTYETAYTDTSGSRCLTFTLGNREADLCSGAIDRPAPLASEGGAD